MKKFHFAAAAAVMATATVALYAAAPVSAQKMDADGDKTITWSEMKTKSDEIWAKHDVNSDGKLDQADRTAKMGEMFDKIDADKNGAISRQEFVAHHQQMMDHKGPDGADKPGDEKMEHGGKRDGRGHRGGMMGGGHEMAGMADANKDGTVTRAEFDTAAKAHFDKIDANKDGKITPEERRAAMKIMMGGMRGHGAHGGMGAMGDGPPPPPPAN
ncbi:MAG: calcium-binding protein [Pseudomonadota bacterium]